ncbi:MAG: sigma 54-interacting transcriptional regulator [Deltaproteobacteria bacterium]|nr:sigma 54-interacting transcriptional regulator [Deltaproteobacteria bacterium]
MRRHAILRALLCILPALSLFFPVLSASEEISPKNVLVLASYGHETPVEYQFSKGIRSIFEAAGPFQIHIDIEHLDMIRFQDERYAQLMLDMFRYKFSQVRPDLIIAVFSAAFDFALKYGPELFPGVPVVFAEVERSFLEGRVVGPHVTGVLTADRYKETFDLALRLHPATRRVAIVAGAGAIGRRWAKAALEVLREYEERIDLIDLSALPIEEILQRVANLPPQTVLVYLPVLVDGAGRKFIAPESLSRISRASSAPAYSCWELLLGHGIAGGYLSSFEGTGKAAAEMALRILRGEKPTNIPFTDESESWYMFDWRELRRWRVAEKKLPTGSVVRFKELTAWDRYRGRIIVIIAVFLLQALIISYLVHQRRVRRRVEQKIKENVTLEKLVSELSSDFIHVSGEDMDSRIQDTLSRVGSFMGADRCYLFRFNKEKTEFRISHVWEAEGIQEDPVVRGVIVEELFPWLAENLIAARDIVIPDVEKLPREMAHMELDYCRRMGIRSFVILPIQVENEPLCAIGMDCIREQRNWPQETLGRLRLVGENVGNALARYHSELNLKQTYDEIKQLKERLEAESAYLQEEIRVEHNFENIIGRSEALKYVLYQVEQVASTDTPVLILGETGTGKELIARAIHRLSPIGRRPLVKVNCAALPADLVESELFGHEKGAFTGAASRQIGRFEIAAGSTLFLDEIGELPLPLQAKLLRVLDSGEFERLGSAATLHTDARIIAVTNRDLQEEVREGRFREDLFYRLKVFAITLPTLRKRKEDIPLLIQWFTEQLSRKLGRARTEIPVHAMKRMQDYDWPGNVRELKHTVESALVTAGGNIFQFDLPEGTGQMVGDFKSYQDMERDYILQVLEATQWKIQGENSAARVLQMHPNTLRARMKKLGIKRLS